MTTFNRIAVGNRVIIKMDIPVKKFKKEGDTYMTAGGIALPSNSKEVANEERMIEGAETGTIVSMGYMAFKGLGNSTPWAKVGDHVGFKRYAGLIATHPNAHPDDKYRCMDDEDICFLIQD